MDVNFYEMRIGQVRDAASRSRWLLATSLVIAGALIAATWNALPFGLYETAQAAWNSKSYDADSQDKILRLLQDELFKGWVQSLFISVPALGIRFSVNDASLLGGVALTILAIWRFFSSRRENHLIGNLFIGALGEPPAIRAYVYYGISGSQVFASISDDDDPISAIRAPKNALTSVDAGGSYTRRVGRYLTYLPALAILISIITDVASIYWIGAAFRAEHHPLGAASVGPGDLIIYTISAGLLVYLWHLSVRTNDYQAATQKLLREAHMDGWATVASGADLKGL